MTRDSYPPLDLRSRPTRESGIRERAGRGGDAADAILGESLAIERVRQQLRRVACFPSVPVLAHGETGTGKEMIAAALHRLGGHGDERPLVSINCAALPESLIESEMFGHEPGAFTGADRKRVGLLEAAAGGTLFLDEIGEMPDPCQAKLLRALEERSFRRVGSNTAIPLTARIISATNRSLRKLDRGGLRADLYYRLAGFTVALPPLRERVEDVPILLHHFLAQFRDRHGAGPRRFDGAAVDLLAGHRWPGNVRELRCVVDHAAILAGEQDVTVDEAKQALEGRPATIARSTMPPRPTSSAPPRPVSMGALRDVERTMIESALRRCDGNVSEAARILRIPRSTLRDKLRRYETA